MGEKLTGRGTEAETDVVLDYAGQTPIGAHFYSPNQGPHITCTHMGPLTNVKRLKGRGVFGECPGPCGRTFRFVLDRSKEIDERGRFSRHWTPTDKIG